MFLTSSIPSNLQQNQKDSADGDSAENLSEVVYKVSEFCQILLTALDLCIVYTWLANWQSDKSDLLFYY